MRYFLIDYENVGSKGCKGISKIKSTDRVLIFYGGCSRTFDVSLVKELQTLGKRVSFIEAEVRTPNSLDFQLVYFLGTLVGKCSSTKDLEIVIVSKDSGYDTIKDTQITALINKPNVRIRRFTMMGSYWSYEANHPTVLQELPDRVDPVSFLNAVSTVNK